MNFFRPFTRRSVLAAGTALVAAASTHLAFAADWPSKPVRIVVGFPGAPRRT